MSSGDRTGHGDVPPGDEEAQFHLGRVAENDRRAAGTGDRSHHDLLNLYEKAPHRPDGLTAGEEGRAESVQSLRESIKALEDPTKSMKSSAQVLDDIGQVALFTNHDVAREILAQFGTIQLPSGNIHPRGFRDFTPEETLALAEKILPLAEQLLEVFQAAWRAAD